MSGTLTRPDWAAAIKDLARRVGMLERRTTPAQETDRSFEITFSFVNRGKNVVPLFTVFQMPPAAAAM